MPDEQSDVRRTLELLWGVARPIRPGPRPALQLEQIVQAAVGYADRHGLAGLTMRQIAAELDIGTASLYTYIPGRSTLLALMLDTIAGYSVLPHTLPGDWRARFEGSARHDWDVFHQHPWVLELVTGQYPPGPNLMTWYDSALRALADTALPDADKPAVIEAVDGYVRGAAWASAGARARGTTAALTADPADEARAAAFNSAMADIFDPQRFPELARVIFTGASPYGENTFEQGLAYVLDGIQLHITHATGEP